MMCDFGDWGRGSGNLARLYITKGGGAWWPSPLMCICPCCLLVYCHQALGTFETETETETKSETETETPLTLTPKLASIYY